MTVTRWQCLACGRRYTHAAASRPERCPYGCGGAARQQVRINAWGEVIRAAALLAALLLLSACGGWEDGATTATATPAATGA